MGKLIIRKGQESLFKLMCHFNEKIKDKKMTAEQEPEIWYPRNPLLNSMRSHTWNQPVFSIV